MVVDANSLHDKHCKWAIAKNIKSVSASTALYCTHRRQFFNKTTNNGHLRRKLVKNVFCKETTMAYYARHKLQVKICTVAIVGMKQIPICSCQSVVASKCCSESDVSVLY